MKTQGQNDNWQLLAEAIRDELRECAWLSSLLEKQQNAILVRDSTLLAETSDLILAQNEQILQSRKKREALMFRACLVMNLPKDSSLSDITAALPDVVRPLFEALVREGISIRRRINHRTEMNHRIARRASMCASEMLEIIRPGNVTRTYDPKGAMKTSTSLKGRMVHTTV
jgi:hypothetical protein